MCGGAANAPLATPRSKRPRTALAAREIATAVLGQASVRLFGVAAGVVVAAALTRGLNRDDFGQLSLVLSLVVMAANLGDLGLGNATTRQLAAEPGDAPKIFGALVAARVATGVGGAGIVVAASWLMDGSSSMRIVAPALGATLLWSPLLAWQSQAVARLRLGRVNGLLLLQSIVWTAIVLVLSLSGARLESYALGFFVAATVQALATWLAFRGAALSFGGIRTHLPALLRLSWPLAVGGFFVTTYYRLDGVILYQVKGASENATYSAAYRFLDVLQFLPATLLTVLLPLLSATWRLDDAPAAARRRRLFALVMTVLAAVALPIVVGGALLAPRLTAVVYGVAYSDAGPLLAVLLLAFPFVCLGYVSVGLALASGRTTIYAGTAAVAAIGNVGANVALIPVYGAQAAAWSTVVTEVLVSTTLLALLLRGEDLHLPWRAWAGSASAAAFMGVVVLVAGHLPLASLLAIAAGAYLPAVFALGGLRLSDVHAALSRQEVVWL